MNVYEFLEKLEKYYPSKENDNTFRERVADYSNSICKYIREHKQQFDFDKVFAKILETYRFTSFPLLPVIFDAMPYGAIIRPFEANLSGNEGEVIKRVINGHEYEFTVVPNSWEGIKTINELDREIARRNRNESTTKSI